MKYNWRKAGVQAFLAFSGCILSHTIVNGEGMTAANLAFWKHVIFVAAVTSGVQELTYLREWAKKFMDGDSAT